MVLYQLAGASDAFGYHSAGIYCAGLRQLHAGARTDAVERWLIAVSLGSGPRPRSLVPRTAYERDLYLVESHRQRFQRQSEPGAYAFRHAGDRSATVRLG